MRVRGAVIAAGVVLMLLVAFALIRLTNLDPLLALAVSVAVGGVLTGLLSVLTRHRMR